VRLNKSRHGLQTAPAGESGLQAQQTLAWGNALRYICSTFTNLRQQKDTKKLSLTINHLSLKFCIFAKILSHVTFYF